MIISKSQTLSCFALRIRCHYHSYYDVLGLEHGASQQDIKRKYYQLAKKYHPDTQEGIKDPSKFVKINEAYQTLGDEQKRIKYDNGFFSPDNRSYGQTEHSQYQYGQAGPRRPQWHYYGGTTEDYRTPNESFFTVLKRSYWSFFFYCCYFYMGIEIFRFVVSRLDQRDREMQERLLQQSPTVTRNRRKYYAKEMKEKNIYGQHVDIKYRVLTKESTRSLQKKKDGMMSIQGIEKEGKPPQDNIVVRPEYI